MLHFVEIPHQSSPSAWSAHNLQDFINIVESSARAARCDVTIFEKTTLRELLERHGYTSASEARAHADGFLADLVEKYEPDVVLYRSDILNRSDYLTRPINEFEACLEFLKRDLYALVWFGTDEEALTALADQNVWPSHQGVDARWSLWQNLQFLKLISD